MNWLERLFRKNKKTYSGTENCKLLIIDETQEHIHEILGISDKRAAELLEVAKKAYEETDMLHTCLERTTDFCVHTNEVVFMTLLLTRVIQAHDSRNSLESLFKALRESRG